MARCIERAGAVGHDARDDCPVEKSVSRERDQRLDRKPPSRSEALRDHAAVAGQSAGGTAPQAEGWFDPLVVHRIWVQAGLKPHRSQRYMASNDPDFERKAADIIGLYLNPPQHAAVFCGDDMALTCPPRPYIFDFDKSF